MIRSFKSFRKPVLLRMSIQHLCYIALRFLFFPLIFLGLDPDISPDEQEEKARLISQVLELQNTLDGKFDPQP